MVSIGFLYTTVSHRFGEIKSGIVVLAIGIPIYWIWKLAFRPDVRPLSDEDLGAFREEVD